jgi:mannose-6-phosphate isomerase-like protein (cupin superfamily)
MTSAHRSVTIHDPTDLESHGSNSLSSVILADETVDVEHVGVGIVTIDPESRGSRHVREIEEIIYVLEGTGRIVTDEGPVDLDAGQAAIIPPGVHHYHENPGKTPLWKLWIFAPQGPKRAIRARSEESTVDGDSDKAYGNDGPDENGGGAT